MGECILDRGDSFWMADIVRLKHHRYVGRGRAVEISLWPNHKED